MACLWRACGVCLCVCLCVLWFRLCLCLSLCLCLWGWCGVVALSSLWCCLSVVFWWIVVDALSAVPSLSEQTWKHHLATVERVMVTPAICPRLLEMLTTLTFGAQLEIILCQHHLRPSRKKKKTHGHGRLVINT